MLAVTEPDTHTITIKAGTQIVKSEFLVNVACYFIHQDPASILFVQPKQDLAEDFSKERFGPTREATPVIQALIPDAKSRDSGVTITHKEYPGGTMDFVGANSPTDLASRPKRIVLSDEIDKYPPSAGPEGDPLSLAEERCSTFWNRKKIRCCSPTIKGFSRIGGEYDLSDQRRCFVACPACGVAQTLKWSQVQWDKDENGNPQSETASYVCEHCGVFWSEADRVRALRSLAEVSDHGWRQTRPFRCCGEEQTPVLWNEHGRSLCATCNKPVRYEGHAGFHISKLYSTRHRLAEVAAEWLSSHKKPQKFKKFTNSALAEEWEDHSEKVDSHLLAERARKENWLALAAPAAILVVTCGVDVQADRVELELIGWGAQEESWSLDYRVIHGDPSAPALWSDLDEYLSRTVVLEDGRELRISATCVDSRGHSTDAVYKFTADKASRRIWAIAGLAGQTRPVWPKGGSRSKKSGAGLYFLVGVDAAKDTIFARLRVDVPGPGYCHFPADREPEWFDQLTSEIIVTKTIGGYPTRVWEPKPNVRNEALDCRVYGFAALRSLFINWGVLQRSAAEIRSDIQKPKGPKLPPPSRDSNWFGSRNTGNWFNR